MRCTTQDGSFLSENLLPLSSILHIIKQLSPLGNHFFAFTTRASRPCRRGVTSGRRICEGLPTLVTHVVLHPQVHFLVDLKVLRGHDLPTHFACDLSSDPFVVTILVSFLGLLYWGRFGDKGRNVIYFVRVVESHVVP